MDAENQIAEARARWAMKQAQADQEKQKQAEEFRRQALAELRLPDWMLEYVGSVKRWEGDSFIALIHLPGCSPFSVKSWEGGPVICYSVREPLTVKHDAGQWVVDFTERFIYGSDDLDAAIDLAASFGESWQEMQGWADRGNADGLKPLSFPSASERAARSLEEARNAYNGAPDDLTAVVGAVAAGMLAAAEQLALLNDTLMKMDR